MIIDFLIQHVILQSDFLKLVNKKLDLDHYKEDYSNHLGLSKNAIKELKRISQTDLVPILRIDDKFDLDEVLDYFNELFHCKKMKLILYFNLRTYLIYLLLQVKNGQL